MLALARKQGPLPVFRFFLICCNTFGIVSLVLRVATIGWNDRSLPMDQTESTTWIVDNQTHLIEITSIPQPSPKDDTFGSSVSSGTGQIQYPILFMASMMCIILYLVGLIGRDH